MEPRISLSIRYLLLVCALSIHGFGQSLYQKGKTALDNRQYADAEVYLARAEAEAPAKTNALALRAKALINLERFAEAEECLASYLHTHPQSPDGTYLLAYVQFRLNQPRQSLENLTKAAQLQRPTSNDLKIVGLDYVLLNDYADAVKWLERSVVENPNDPESQYHLGRAYYVLNSFEKAVAAFQRTLSLKPDDAKALDNLGLCYDAMNQPERAEEAFRRAIATAQNSQKPNPQPYVNLADLLSRNSDNPEALGLLSTAEKLGGPLDRIHELKARVYLSENQLTLAEAETRAAIALQPENGSFHYLFGRILKKEGKNRDADREFALTRTLLGTQSSQSKALPTGRQAAADYVDLARLNRDGHPEDAMTELGKALAIAPGDRQASEMVRSVAHDAALTYLRQGQRQEALNILSQASGLLPSDPDLLYQYGLTALEAGDSKKARECLTKAIGDRTNFPDALYALARADLAESRAQDAESLMREYVKARPKDATGQYGLGYILVTEQKLADAEAAFESSLQLAPHQTESVFQLGEIALERDDTQTARSRFLKVLHTDPGHAGALTGSAVIEYRAGRYNEAKDLLERAITRTPDYQKAHYFQALTLLKLGEKEAAEKEFAVARSLQKTHGGAGNGLSQQ